MGKVDRNSKKQIKLDIGFLNEMLIKLEKSPQDIVTCEYLRKMITDWKDELVDLTN